MIDYPQRRNNCRSGMIGRIKPSGARLPRKQSHVPRRVPGSTPGLGAMKKRLYNDKRPRAHALLPREHYAKKNGSWKPKRAFPSELSARLYLSTQMSADGYRAYRCTVCGKWHVGKYTKDGDADQNE